LAPPPHPPIPNPQSPIPICKYKLEYNFILMNIYKIYKINI